jgi:GT2 family glycosyltransferase
MHDLTFLIKTFQRRDCLARCLRSVFQFHPGAKVVIAEDSFTPYAEELVETDFPEQGTGVNS